ncbi:hypothetical protein [Collinsella tanakaei]|uniref:ApeA N-terminal domain 1-containing protein n=1 Tax=Collinsella tanakaei TaxID=626935 RepID=UPI0025A3762B|nr:hypothetical protein [Collinsella tanakaei]MDM8301666.1 hypothetical protein [Collinsella tanakaei]
MDDMTWKTALWDTSWEELFNGKESEEGVCRFSKTDGAALEIPFGDISNSRTPQATVRPFEGIAANRYNHIFGFTQDGIMLALCDVISNGVGGSAPGSTHETFNSSTVLASKRVFEPDAQMLSAQFEIELLSKWLGIRYKPIQKDDACTFDYRKSSLSLPLHTSLNACVEIRVGIRKPRETLSGVTVHYYCLVCIEYSQGKTVDDIWCTDLWKLQSFFSFCFGAYPEIKSAKVRQGRNDNWIQVYRSSANTSRPAKLSSQPPIPFHELGTDGLHRLSEKWFSLNGDMRHAVEILTSLQGTWKMPFDLQLLAATTMFESLIRADRPPIYGAEALDELIEPIVASAKKDVRGRVKGLLSLLDKPSYNQILEEAYEEGRPWSERLIPYWSKFKKEQYSLRITGAHGINSNEGPHLRVDHYYAQITLAYFILMKRLGLPPETIDRFERSSFLNVARWNITKRYAKQ